MMQTHDRTWMKTVFSVGISALAGLRIRVQYSREITKREVFPQRALGRHHFIKWKWVVAGRCNSSFYFSHCILISQGIALLIIAKLPMLTQVEAIWNFSILYDIYASLPLRNEVEFFL
jgi:hypothetical protein